MNELNIIPLAENSKEPLKGFNLAKYFVEKYPSDSIPANLNRGLITGKTSGLAVIDLDTDNKEIFQKYLVNYPTQMVQKSPHGYHLFYEHNPNLPAIKKIADGDFFNGNHYVVLSPSKVNGVSYEWLNQGQPGELPNNLFQETPIQIQSGKYSRKEIYDLINYALEYGKPQDAAGNDTILYGSMVLAGDGWGQNALLTMMKALNKARKSPESEHVVESMVTRGIEYSKKKPEKESITSTSTQFAIADYGSMIDKYANYSPSWLVDQWLPTASIIICSALPERFKTWLAVDLAISVASGLPFFDHYEINNPGKVLIVQQEDHFPEILARFKTVERAKLFRAQIPIGVQFIEGTWIYTNPYYIGDQVFFHEDAELSFDRLESVDRLSDRIKEIGAVLCIIDPFYSLSTNDDYFAKTAAQIRQYIKKIRNETGCTFLFIHHNKKSGKTEIGDNLSRDQIYGSTFVSAVMEGAITIGRDNDMGETEILAIRRYKTHKVGTPVKIKFHIDMSKDDAEAYSVEIDELVNDKKTLVITYLTENGPTTYTNLFNVFQGEFGSKTTFTAFLKKLVGHGITQEGVKGKYSAEVDAQ